MCQRFTYARTLMLIALSGLSSTAYCAQRLSTVKVCELGSSGPTVTLLRSHRIGDTFKYFARVSRQTAKPIFEGDDDQARGTLIKATCAGTKAARALVVSGEFFGSGYPKGVAYAWNASQQKLERVDFAERAFPSRVYLNPTGMQLLFANRGGETSAKFVLYQHDAASDKTETLSIDTAPESTESAINLDRVEIGPHK